MLPGGLGVCPVRLFVLVVFSWVVPGTLVFACVSWVWPGYCLCLGVSRIFVRSCAAWVHPACVCVLRRLGLPGFLQSKGGVENFASF